MESGTFAQRQKAGRSCGGHFVQIEWHGEVLRWRSRRWGRMAGDVVEVPSPGMAAPEL
jgi:hypothetical protein